MRYTPIYLMIMMVLSVNLFAGDPSYAFSKIVDLSFEKAITKVTAELKKEGFGIITEIDVQATMKKKLDKDMKPYKILGAWNPKFAYESIQAEEQIGLFLPCNVIVYVNENGNTVVSAVDPMAMMQAVDNTDLAATGNKVQKKLQKVIDNL